MRLMDEVNAILDDYARYQNRHGTPNEYLDNRLTRCGDKVPNSVFIEVRKLNALKAVVEEIEKEIALIR